jgi:hypothetical protein
MQTLTEIERFQSTHFNHLGHRLDVDDDIGPETRWSMDFETLSSERRLVGREAQKFLGLKEFPPHSNLDPQGIIKAWVERCGAQPGEPWCASGLCAWLSVVMELRIPGALNLGRHFPETTTPWACDIYTFPTNAKGNGHCGLVIGVGLKEIMGIEANSNDEVACVRRARMGLRFGRTFDETLGTCPKVILEVPLAGGGTR